MSPPQDYTTWNAAQLVTRVTDLEDQLRRQASQLSTLRKQAKVHPAHTDKSGKPRQARAFDASKYTTRRVALKIAYLGARYNGFEHHTNNTTPLPTVEEILWHALVKTKLIFKEEAAGVDWTGLDYSKAGRTDKGVSAFGNVVALHLRSSRPLPGARKRRAPDSDDDAAAAEPFEEKLWDPIADELAYPRLLNRVLPPDVRVLAWCPSLADDFSARFSCRLRKYRYFFTQPAFCPAPGARGVAARLHDGIREREGWLDIEAMSAAAARFEGMHDFRNFCKQDPARQIHNFERRVDRARIVAVPRGELGLPFLAGSEVAPLKAAAAQPQLYAFEVWGSAFLWHQVRHMASALFLVGAGLEGPGLIDALLDAKANAGKPLYDMADDHPLVLWDCVFPDLSSANPAPADSAGPVEDALHWILPDNGTTPGTFTAGGDGRYGISGINDVLWAGWRRAKMDEVLAGQLLNAVAVEGQEHPPQSTDVSAAAEEAAATNNSNRGAASSSVKVFDGSADVRRKGAYVPVLARPRQEAPEVLNARWLARGGKASKVDAGADADADADRKK